MSYGGVTDASSIAPIGFPLTVDALIVLVVDDHALMRATISQTISALPEVERVVVARDYAEAEREIAALRPDIIWLDLHVGQGDSMAEVNRLRQLTPDSLIIALDDTENERDALAAVMAGAQGYYSKQDLDVEAIMTINRMIKDRQLVMRPALALAVMQNLRAVALPVWDDGGATNGSAARSGTLPGSIARNPCELTRREREILELIRQGFRDRDVSLRLHISLKTVQKHVQNILSKLGARNRTEAAYLTHGYGTSTSQ